MIPKPRYGRDYRSEGGISAAQLATVALIARIGHRHGSFQQAIGLGMLRLAVGTGRVLRAGWCRVMRMMAMLMMAMLMMGIVLG